MKSATQMKNVITKILEKRGKLAEFESGEFHLRIENEPYMPLVIERHGNQITITHYFTQNGDMIADPDMEFLQGADGEWHPIALQLCTGSYFRARWNENGKEFVNPRQVREQIQFANMWARNIRWQGF